jgi:hypothetical protein
MRARGDVVDLDQFVDQAQRECALGVDEFARHQHAFGTVGADHAP